MPLRVIKLGGSLLTLPDLVPRLQQWLAQQSPACHALVVGGGSLIDAVRKAQWQARMSDSDAHWQSIQAMREQSLRVAALLGGAALMDCEELRSAAAVPATLLLDPWRFVRENDRRLSPDPLPESWDVTSDSIAARLACLLPADELVLLKSAPARSKDLSALAAAGYVDKYFPQAAPGHLPVRFVDFLRETAASCDATSGASAR